MQVGDIIQHTLFPAQPVDILAAANTPAGISIISSYFPPGKSKNTAFAVLGAGQPIGYIIGMILGTSARVSRPGACIV